MSLLKQLIVPSGESTDISGLSDSDENSHASHNKKHRHSIEPKQTDEERLPTNLPQLSTKRLKKRNDSMYRALETRTDDVYKDSSFNSTDDSELSLIPKDSNSRRRRRLIKSKPSLPETYIDPLELKYIELNDILLRDYVERKKPERNVPTQNLGRLCEQYISVHGRPPPVPGLARALIPSSPRPTPQTALFKVNIHLRHNDDDISTRDERSEKHGVKMVKFQRPTSATVDRVSRSRTRDQERANSTGLRRSRSAGSNRLARRKVRSNASVRSDSMSCGKQDSSLASSPRSLNEPVDCHLKATHNDDILAWLKRKNQLLKEENKQRRDRKRQERLEQANNVVAIHERSLLSEKEARKWMMKKKHDAWVKQKEEKITQDLVMRDLRSEQRLIHSCLKPLRSDDNVAGVGKPRRSVNFNLEDTSGSQNKIQMNDENNNNTASHSESTNNRFIYKRAATGKIRFKMPTNKKAQTRPISAERDKRDKKGQIRVSYDQWLLLKRNEEIQKRKTEQNNDDKALSQSVAENQVLVEAGKKKIREVKEKKTTLDTGIPSIRRNSEKKEDDSPREYHSNNQTRPKPSTRSPSRVQPRLKQAMESKVESNPFTLPFPPEFGVPKHVASKKREIFSNKVSKSVDYQSEKNGNGEEVKADEVAELLNDSHDSNSTTSLSSSCSEDIEEEAPDKDGPSPRYGFNKASPAETTSSDNEDGKRDKNTDSAKDTSKPSDADGTPGESFFITSVDLD